MNPHLPLLCVVLVAETRYDLPQTSLAALRVSADPFGPLLQVYHEAVGVFLSCLALALALALALTLALSLSLSLSLSLLLL